MKRSHGLLTSAVACFLLASTAAQGVTIFTAMLDGAQETPSPVVTAATGSATLTLNDDATRLEILVQINGLDLDGNQTPENTLDNVVSFHIHRAPVGVGGPVVFGFISPNSDLNGDLVINAAAGTVFSAWDLNEGNNTTLAAELNNLRDGLLYLNVHTVARSTGEIRGQIVPEPATLAMLGLGAAAIVRRRGEAG